MALVPFVPRNLILSPYFFITDRRRLKMYEVGKICILGHGIHVEEMCLAIQKLKGGRQKYDG
jgi:hypothetical protein